MRRTKKTSQTLLQPTNNETTVQPNPMMSRIASADFLCVTTRTLDSLVQKGLLQKVKIGRRTVFEVEELQRFIRSCRISQ